MADSSRDYGAFLTRLAGYERTGALPRSRGPDKLAGMLWLVRNLDHPERFAKVVHVAGTNGKGTTCAMIANVLQAAGLRVGLYTSPHVMDLRERIVVNGQWVAAERLAQVGHAVLDLADSVQDRMYCSYFDLLTAMGLAVFREERVQWVVLETGLGGLADATNIGPKELAVITRIGMDHMATLGNTLREIASQKLGIVRSGVPTVLAAQKPDLQEWMEAEIQARNSLPVPAWRWSAELLASNSVQAQAMQVGWPDGATVRIDGLAGVTKSQLASLGAALAAAEIALGPAPMEARAGRTRSALSARLPGRMERRFRQHIAGTAVVIDQVVLDGGHNAEALRLLDCQLAAWGLRGYTLVFGMQADKLVDEALPPLARLIAGSEQVVILAPQTARAASAEELERFVRRAQHGAHSSAMVRAVPNPRAALLAAGDPAHRPVVVTGSFWMLGDIMRLLEPA